MNLYLLRPKDGRPEWKTWYDKAHGFVIAASTSTEARQIADAHAGDENSTYNPAVRPWLDESASTAEVIGCSDSLKAGMILRDFAAA